MFRQFSQRNFHERQVREAENSVESRTLLLPCRERRQPREKKHSESVVCVCEEELYCSSPNSSIASPETEQRETHYPGFPAWHPTHPDLPDLPEWNQSFPLFVCFFISNLAVYN